MNKRIRIYHALIHSFFEMLAGVIFGFGIYMLVQRGYSASEAGLCISIGGILCILITPFISDYLDNSNSITIFDVIVIVSFMFVAIFSINYFIENKCIVLTILMIMLNCLVQLLDGYVNSIYPKFVECKVNINYSIARACGSVSYGLICGLLGVVTNHYSYKFVLIVGVVVSILFLIISVLIKSSYINVSKDVVINNLNDETISFKEFVLNNKVFIVLCLFLIGIFIGYTSTDNFLLIVVENIGGNSEDMGLILAVKAILEGIAMFFFYKVNKKFNLNTILCSCVLFFVVKQLIILLSKNIVMLYVAQIFQMASFAMLFPAMIEYINISLKKREIIRGNSIFCLTISIGSIISSYLAGSIIDNYGAYSMELFALVITLFSALGFIVTFIYGNKRKTICK